MRRFVILVPALVLAAGLAACANFRDLFSAHADVAADAAGQELPSKRLGQIMAGAKGGRINRETAEFIANVWVDYTLFGQAVVRGRLPADSASIAEAVWPELAELKGNHWHDTLVSRRVGLGDSAADSVYRSPDTRVLQHILFGVRPNAAPEVKTEKRKRAEATLGQVRRGVDFARLASQLSEDPGSRSDSGYLPPSPRGRFVPVFDSVGWSLEPGQASGLVETPFGFHIIKRPTLEAVRTRIYHHLQALAGARLDSLYMDSLAAANDIEIASGAAAAMRAASQAPDDSRKSSKTLTRFTGGELTVQDYLRWVRALPPQYVSQLREADDSMLGRFARILTQNVLLLREADSGGATITPLEWASLQQNYLSQLDTLKAEMGLATYELTDSSVALGDREKLAALKVEQYFDGLITGQSRLRPLPSALATLLRERMPYRLHDAGINQAVELAQETKQADSATAKGPLQPAPGPPPVPGLPAPPADTIRRDTAHPPAASAKPK